jgi:hypothetical protein
MALVTVCHGVTDCACWFLLARSKVVHQHSALLAHHDVDRRVSLMIGTNSHYWLLIWFGSFRTFQSFRNLVGLRMILSLLIHDGSIKSCTSTFCTFGSSRCGSLSKCDQGCQPFFGRFTKMNLNALFAVFTNDGNTFLFIGTQRMH